MKRKWNEEEEWKGGERPVTIEKLSLSKTVRE
jgi:hypothetical protein